MSMFRKLLFSQKLKISGGKNIISWWKLDEGSGSIAHDSVGTNNLSIGGISTPTWTTGHDGNPALSFSNGKASIADNSSLSVGSGDFRITAWVLSPSSTTWRGIATKDNGEIVAGSKYWGIFIDTHHKLHGLISDGITTINSSGGSAVDDGAWHFVEMEWVGGHLIMSVDGTQVDDQTGSLGGLDNAADFEIGNDTVDGDPFVGSIQDVRFFRPSNVLISEDYEGTGTPTNFSIGSGSPDFHNTSGPLSGTKDLLMGNGDDVVINFGTFGEIWLVTEFSYASPPSSSAAFIFLDVDATHYASIHMDTSGHLQIEDNGTGVGSATTDVVPANTKVWIWFHVKKGTGANAIYDVEFSTTNSRTGSGTKFTSYSAGTQSASFTEAEFSRNSAWSVSLHFDNTKIYNVTWP